VLAVRPDERAAAGEVHDVCGPRARALPTATRIAPRANNLTAGQRRESVGSARTEAEWPSPILHAGRRQAVRKWRREMGLLTIIKKVKQKEREMRVLMV
jgi:hypothetical protein